MFGFLSRRRQTKRKLGANALEEAKDWHGMFDWCQRWTKSNPENADAWYHLGVACYSLGRYNEAINAYREVIGISPKFARAWRDLGTTHGKLKRIDDAIFANHKVIDLYREAILINPKDVEAWYGLGIAYAGTANNLAALDAGRQLRLLDSDRAERLFDTILPR